MGVGLPFVFGDGERHATRSSSLLACGSGEHLVRTAMRHNDLGPGLDVGAAIVFLGWLLSAGAGVVSCIGALTEALSGG